MEPRSLSYIAQAAEGELLHGSPDKMVARLCTDSRVAEPNDLFFALSGERFDAHSLLEQLAGRGIGAIVAERRKLPPNFCSCAVIAVENTRRALGNLGARYRRDFDPPVIAVGGSNGKTTTKELIASVLRRKKAVLWSEASFNNEIGVPLTLLRMDRSHQAAVLEAGTNHPGELAPLIKMIAPSIGVITNIGREHLEFFGDLAGVAKEEGALAEGLPKPGILFVNGDNEWAAPIARRAASRVARVGLKPNNDYRAENIQSDERGALFSVRCPQERLEGEYRIQLLGRHSVVNALLALAVGAELGLDRIEISQGLASCIPPKMRLQLWDAGGVSVIDDSYNANADSMLAALDTLRGLNCAGRRVAVLGDMAELGETSDAAHGEVGRRAAELQIDQLFTVGPCAARIAESARNAGMSQVEEFSQAASAAEAVKKFVRAGDAVLVKASRCMGLERIVETLRNDQKERQP